MTAGPERPFEEQIFNEMVVALVYMRSSRPRPPQCGGPPPPPPPPHSLRQTPTPPPSPPRPVMVPRRKRSRQITLQGIREAKREEELGKEARMRVSNDQALKKEKGKEGKKPKKDSAAAAPAAAYSIKDGGRMKLILRKIPCSPSPESKALPHHLPPPPLC